MVELRTKNLAVLVLLLTATHAAAFFLGAAADNGLQVQPQTISGERNAAANIVAVAQDGRGTVGKVEVEIVPGSGKVLLDTNPFVETDTQFSAKTAKQVAEAVTGTTLEDKNVIYTFTIDGNYLGGPSAGAAMTAATIAAIRNTSVRKDVAVTGTIRPDHRIGQVGGIMGKAAAAGQQNMNLFLVPAGQEQFTYYEEVVRTETTRGGFRYRDVEYVPRTLSVNNMTQTEYGMETRPVQNVQELTNVLLKE